MAAHTNNGRQVSSRRVSSNGAAHSSEGGAGVAEWPTEVAVLPGNHPSTFGSTAHNRGNGQAELCKKYGINEENLALRRDFLRLGEEERTVLAELAPWARSVAPVVAKAFYDWQFSFTPTREYFEGFAHARQMSLTMLRQHLETAQAGYFAEVFEGAAANWDVEYFERRLKVGKVHDKIDLPLKWYVGSYAEYQRLTGIFLRKSFKDQEKIAQAERAVSKIFNLDLQAIVDSYLLSTVESMGFNAEIIKAEGDKTEHILELKRATAAMQDQLTVLGKGDLRSSDFDVLMSDPSLEAWDLGDSVKNLLGFLRSFIVEMNRMSREHDKGDIDVVIPAENFEGDYRIMAQGVNEMVAAHIAMNRKAMACVAEFGKGNFEAPLDLFPGKQALINDTIERVRGNLKALITDTDVLVNAAVEGKLETRADVSKHEGDFCKIVDGINRTLDAVVDKTNWYEGILDAVQFPIHVIDKDMKWVFLNKAFEKLMVDNGTIRSRKDAPGMPCSSANASICKTDHCGLVQLAKGNGETYFDWGAQNCKQESSKLVNRKGKHIGFVEVVQDLTPLVRAKNYTSTEVIRLASNLVQISKGDLNVNLKQADADNFSTEVKAQFGQINVSLVEVVNAINEQAAAAQSIAAGDLSVAINVRSETDVVAKSLLKITQSLQDLVADADMLANGAVEGKLAIRADARKHQGEYRKVVEGMNHTLEAVIGPLNVAADYVDKISRGEIPVKITANYRGDFNEIKDNLNRCIDSLSGLIAEMNRMSDEHSQGDIDVTIPAEKFEGAYRAMAQGVNDMAAGHIIVKKKAMACVAEFGKGNFEAPLEKFPGKKAFINDTIEQVRTNLKALIADTDALVKAAEDGKLGTRADANKHLGDFRKIVEGINQTLDMVVTPLKATAENASTLSSSSEELTAVSQQMAGNAERPRSRQTLCRQPASRYREMSLPSQRLPKRCRHRSERSRRMPMTRHTWQKMR